METAILAALIIGFVAGYAFPKRRKPDINDIIDKSWQEAIKGVTFDGSR